MVKSAGLFRAAAGWLLTFGAILGAASMWLIAIIVCYDVTLRFAGRPTLWALEIATYLMIASAIFASGKAVIDEGHFAVRIVPEALSRRSRTWLDRLMMLACIGVMVFVTYGFISMVRLSAQLDMKSATLLRIPLIYPQSALAFGAALMCLGFIVRLIKNESLQ